jgi:hypothetical protein
MSGFRANYNSRQKPHFRRRWNAFHLCAFTLNPYRNLFGNVRPDFYAAITDALSFTHGKSAGAGWVFTSRHGTPFIEQTLIKKDRSVLIHHSGYTECFFSALWRAGLPEFIRFNRISAAPFASPANPDFPNSSSWIHRVQPNPNFP